MTVEAELLGVALRITRELERANIPYFLAGSLASMIHGEPRATLDVDLVVSMTPNQAQRLADALERDFHFAPDWLVDAARTQPIVNVFHKRPFLKVDLHVRAQDGHSREEMRRAVSIQVGTEEDEVLRVATAEDVVLHKLRWYRAGGERSDRQWRDVLGVLKRARGRLDERYLERWARELDVLDLLTRALGESR
jgi:hypothetical protein